jgi:hypothetical protein
VEGWSGPLGRGALRFDLPNWHLRTHPTRA